MQHLRSPALLTAAMTALTLAAGPVALSPALAQTAALSLPVNQRNLVSAELRPGWTTERGTRMAALHIRLAEGWKTYWRIPGEAGIAPQLDFSASQNLASVQAHWPRPVIFDQGGFRSIGYHGELVLPIELTPQRPGRPIAVSAQILIGICDDICVPVDLTLSVALRGAGSHDPVIAAALDTSARPAGPAGLRAARCAVAPGERGMNLTVRATLPQQGRGEQMILEMPGTGYWLSGNRSWREGGDLIARARVRAPADAAISIDRSAIAFTVLSADGMLEHHGCTAATD